MSALPNREYDDATAQLELQALEKMVAALCEDVERLTREAGSRGALGSREADFQSQAFAERRTQALDLLHAERPEPCEIRITRLEKMVQALTSSREYFRAIG